MIPAAALETLAGRRSKPGRATQIHMHPPRVIGAVDRGARCANGEVGISVRVDVTDGEAPTIFAVGALVALDPPPGCRHEAPGAAEVDLHGARTDLTGDARASRADSEVGEAITVDVSSALDRLTQESVRAVQRLVGGRREAVCAAEIDMHTASARGSVGRGGPRRTHCEVGVPISVDVAGGRDVPPEIGAGAAGAVEGLARRGRDSRRAPEVDVYPTPECRPCDGGAPGPDRKLDIAIAVEVSDARDGATEAGVATVRSVEAHRGRRREPRRAPEVDVHPPCLVNTAHGHALCAYGEVGVPISVVVRGVSPARVDGCGPRADVEAPRRGDTDRALGDPPVERSDGQVAVGRSAVTRDVEGHHGERAGSIAADLDAHRRIPRPALPAQRRAARRHRRRREG